MHSSRSLLTFVTISLAAAAACTPSNAARPPVANTDSATDTLATNASPVTPPTDNVADPQALPPPADVAPSNPPVMARPILLPQPSGPYGVRVVDASSRTLPTYTRGGRTYVMGTVGSRYSILVTNPTGHRVEAVVSVDGLDAMDGHPANYVEKRGYILPPYGDMSVDGFRTSYEQVATFRFSSVANSYAGRLGEARDVGVIGVAFFPERPPVYVPPPPVAVAPRPVRHYAPRPSYKSAPGRARQSTLPSADDVAPPSAQASREAPRGGGGFEESKPTKTLAAPDERRGLGTEFGEARDSHIGLTEFERANPTTPSELVAIRYNDRAGLVALGIRIAPLYPSADLSLRETADPFRGNGFAQPPP
jgi:hypothetical protein